MKKATLKKSGIRLVLDYDGDLCITDSPDEPDIVVSGKDLPQLLDLLKEIVKPTSGWAETGGE